MGTRLYGGVIVLYLALFALIALRRFREDPFLSRGTLFSWLFGGVICLVAITGIGQMILESCATGMDACLRL